MKFKKFRVASGAVVGVAAAAMLPVSPVMAAPAYVSQKSCVITSQSNPSCKTGTLPANSSAHAITICAEYFTTSQAFDNNTGKQVGTVKATGVGLHCTDIGGLYGTAYYVRAAGNVGGKGYISN